MRCLPTSAQSITIASTTMCFRLVSVCLWSAARQVLPYNRFKLSNEPSYVIVFPSYLLIDYLKI